MPHLSPTRLLAFVFLLAGVVVATSTATAEVRTIEGRVVGVTDGDTLTLLTADKQQVRIRLAEIDAPESGQPYGTKAKLVLSELAFGKNVQARVMDTDRYGRTVARVHEGVLDINAELVRRGAAWAYRKYLTETTLLAVEAEAKAARRGLWALPETERVAPWEWRRPSSTNSRTATFLAMNDGGGFTCGAKRTCGQMSSCAEARHYLEVCGLNRLDGDRDGIPCESLCRR